mgnify:CR=1 FL=1
MTNNLKSSGVDTQTTAVYNDDIVAKNNELSGVFDSEQNPKESTAPATFSTFNTAGHHNADVEPQVDNLIQNSQVLGLQETNETQLGHLIARHGNTNDSGEYSPIFYDKSRFEPVHTESVELPGGRVGNIAVLRDKESGALVTVGNAHYKAGNTAGEKIEEHQIMTDAMNNVTENFNTLGQVLLGDFNVTIKALNNEYDNQDFGTGSRATVGDRTFDGVGETNAATSTDPNVIDGGESDHNSVSRTFTFDYNPEETNFHLPTVATEGAVIFSDVNYGGDADIVGFGAESNGISNDSASSVYVGDNTTVGLGQHSANDTRSSGQPLHTTDDSITGMPEGWNDEVSYVELT